MEQSPWWVAALATPILLGIGWMVKFVLNTITTSQQGFIDYLKQQTDNDREEREGWRKTLTEHTEISRQMYHVLEKISETLLDSRSRQ